MKLPSLTLAALAFICTLSTASPSDLPDAVNAREVHDADALHSLWKLMVPPSEDNQPSLSVREVEGRDSGPPKFNTPQEYISFAKLEKSNAAQTCDATSSPEDCQKCLAAAIIAWLGALYLCVAESAAGPVGVITATVCSAAATGVYWGAKVKCMGV